eukprot:1552757-Rhodomonas_salina.1
MRASLRLPLPAPRSSSSPPLAPRHRPRFFCVFICPAHVRRVETARAEERGDAVKRAVPDEEEADRGLRQGQGRRQGPGHGRHPCPNQSQGGPALQ